MSFLTIDQDRCKRDGICVAECPLGLIEIKGEDAFPTPIGPAQELCINCGHCVAVCPHGALSITSMKSDDCAPFRNNMLPSPEQLEIYLKSRRSIRVYKDKPVPRAELTQVIDWASYAPSAHNAQPVHWLVIEDTAEVRRLTQMVADWMGVMVKENPAVAKAHNMDLVKMAWERGDDRILRGAPHLIIAHAPKDYPPALSACTIAVTYLELAAYALGLGACWAGYFYAASTIYPPLISALDLPAGHGSFGAMMIGYPKFTYHRIPVRNTPRIMWR
ncbi:MAG: nitroreductase family protein [Deltaproteobacteria bacterium]|nr:nitroreductase family protein [Deltaproteobacteria bacterium]